MQTAVRERSARMARNIWHYRLMISALTLIVFDNQLEEIVKKDLRKLVGLQKAIKKIKQDEEFISVVEHKPKDQ